MLDSVIAAGRRVHHRVLLRISPGISQRQFAAVRSHAPTEAFLCGRTMTPLDKKTKGRKPSETAPDAPPNDTGILRPAGEVRVSYKKNPTPSGEGKNIHPRRPLPPIPDKRDKG